MKKTTTVSACVAIENGRVLLTRRAPGQKLEGMWEFPGGKLEQNETIQECLERELLEELGVESAAREVLTESHYEYPGGVIKLVAIITELASTEFTLSVHDMAEWAPISTILKYELAPADVPIAKEVMKRYGQ